MRRAARRNRQERIYSERGLADVGKTVIHDPCENGEAFAAIKSSRKHILRGQPKTNKKKWKWPNWYGRRKASVVCIKFRLFNGYLDCCDLRRDWSWRSIFLSNNWISTYKRNTKPTPSK